MNSMLYYKLVLSLIAIFSGGATINLYATDIEPFHFENKVEAEFLEDLEALSTIYLSTSKDFSINRSGKCLTSFKYAENTSEYSKLKAYFLEHRFITPGLDLSDIIYPFHFFK